MRLLAIATLALIALSGCVQSQTTYEGPDDCIMFCGGDTSSTTIDVTPFIIGGLFIVGLIVAAVVVAATAGGDSGRGQQQQQQVVVVTKDEYDR